MPRVHCRIRPRAFLALTALLWALPGCLGTQGPALPDLSAERNQLDQRRQRLERIREVMNADLADLERLREQLIEVDSAFLAQPFPLDLFKQVAVECLNEPWESTSLERTASDSSRNGALGLTCNPEFGRRLLDELDEETPERREQALAKLETLDKWRQLRGKLRQRLSDIPAIVRASERLLAAQRAELRQARASFARRRTEYTEPRWREVEQRLDEMEADLDALEDQIEHLRRVFPEWSPTLDRSVSMLYMELTNWSS